MKILFTRFPLESTYGGAEVQTLSLMKGLNKRGHDVSFLGSCPVLLKKSANYQIPTIHLEIGPPPVTKWGAISFLWRKRKMQQELIAHCGKPDAMVMLSLSEKILLSQWATSHGIKVFWLEHDRIGRWLRSNPWLSRVKKLSKLVTTIPVSGLSRDLYIELGFPADRVVAIPNGIDVKKFDPTPREPQTPFRFGCIARLTYDKGVDILLQAMNDMPNTTLRIIGKGPEEKNLRDLIQKLGLNEAVTIEPDTNTAKFYQEIDALILPSRDNDPFGLVIAEAMASGIPTIATDQCGIASHLSSGDALIVTADDADSLGHALQKVQDKSVWHQLATKGPKIARERFSKERMIDDYEKQLCSDM